MNMKKFKLYSCLGLMFVSILVPLKTLAYDESFYSGNDILFYNPDSTGPTNSTNSNNPEVPSNPEEEINLTNFVTSGPVIANTTSLEGSDALGKIIYFYTHNGLSLAQAAGIAGNFWRESTFIINNINQTSKAYGIAQWLDRKPALFEYTKTESPTLEEQLEFSWFELYGTNGKNGKEQVAYTKLLDTKTPAEAALSVYYDYERADDTPEVIQLRIDYARAIYKRMGGIE